MDAWRLSHRSPTEIACMALACYDGGVSTASAQLPPLAKPGD